MAQAHTNGPRISPVWLAGLLSGEAHCQWASWFRTHHEDWDKVEVPGLPGLDWETQYTYQLNDCIKRYEAQGYTVSNGGPNAYSLSIGEAVLSGRPDVIAAKGEDCVVIDFPKGEGEPLSRVSGHDAHVRPAQGCGAVPGYFPERGIGLLGRTGGDLGRFPRP